MPGLVPGIHVLLFRRAKTWMAGHRRAEATPFFERLCPAMTESDVARMPANAKFTLAECDEPR
jgi:hypothetical protein